MLEVKNSALIVIDVQEKLARVMHGKDRFVANLEMLVNGMRILEVPVLLSEQYPQGLGKTIPEISQALEGNTAISKTSFSCCGNERFTSALNSMERRQLIIAGIEAHICVYQTAVDLVTLGYEVYVASDAVSSRTLENKNVGLALMEKAGAVISSVESILFELLKQAGGDKFRAISRLVK